jgi:hypothetical protein
MGWNNERLEGRLFIVDQLFPFKTTRYQFLQVRERVYKGRSGGAKEMLLIHSVVQQYNDDIQIVFTIYSLLLRSTIK